MPTYDYFCEECKYAEEVFQKITAEPLQNCPKCLKNSFRRRPAGGLGLSFKGEGFYVNDYSPKKTESSCCPCGKNNSSCS